MISSADKQVVAQHEYLAVLHHDSFNTYQWSRSISQWCWAVVSKGLVQGPQTVTISEEEMTQLV